MDYALPRAPNVTLYDVITPPSQTIPETTNTSTVTYFDPDVDPGYVIMRRLQTVLIPFML
ncbi:hypothetical protein BaRGS_00039592, partial [Batillaria attramentaria]